MTQNENKIGVSRQALLLKLIERLYGQPNIQKICRGDYMVIPISKIDDWAHDMGVLMGEAIKDLLDE